MPDILGVIGGFGPPQKGGGEKGPPRAGRAPVGAPPPDPPVGGLPGRDLAVPPPPRPSSCPSCSFCRARPPRFPAGGRLQGTRPTGSGPSTRRSPPAGRRRRAASFRTCRTPISPSGTTRCAGVSRSANPRGVPCSPPRWTRGPPGFPGGRRGRPPRAPGRVAEAGARAAPRPVLPGPWPPTAPPASRALETGQVEK